MKPLFTVFCAVIAIIVSACGSDESSETFTAPKSQYGFSMHVVFRGHFVKASYRASAINDPPALAAIRESVTLFSCGGERLGVRSNSRGVSPEERVVDTDFSAAGGGEITRFDFDGGTAVRVSNMPNHLTAAYLVQIFDKPHHVVAQRKTWTSTCPTSGVPKGV